MSSQSERINTIIALLNTNPSLGSNNLNKVKAELREVVAVHSITPIKRSNLLKILHSTRALDSTLNSFLDFHSIKNNSHSIGQYLHQLQNHSLSTIGTLSPAERSKYQTKIANIRNKHLHQADSYPQNEREVNELISEMQTLIVRVTTL